MWVIVYQPPQAARAALAHAYLWDRRDTGTQNPSSPESFVNRRMVVPRPPPAAFRYLYRNSYDTSFSNPSTPASFVNRRMRVDRPPASIFRLLYRPGHDTSFSNPSTPESFVNRRTRVPVPPRAVWRALYWNSHDTRLSNDETPLSWTARPVRQPYAPSHLLYVVGHATDPSNVEQPLSWTSRPVVVSRISRGTLAALYLWAEATDTPAAVDEQAPFWQAQRLRQPYAQPYVARPFYFAGDATGEDAPVESPPATATYIPTFHARRR